MRESNSKESGKRGVFIPAQIPSESGNLGSLPQASRIRSRAPQLTLPQPYLVSICGKCCTNHRWSSPDIVVTAVAAALHADELQHSIVVVGALHWDKWCTFKVFHP